MVDQDSAAKCDCTRLKTDRWLLLQHILTQYPKVVLPPGCALRSLDLADVDIPSVLLAITEGRSVILGKFTASPCSDQRLCTIRQPTFYDFVTYGSILAVPPPEALMCPLATYETVLLTLGLLVYASYRHLDAVLTELRVGLGISADQHATLLRQLSLLDSGFLPSSAEPGEVATHFAARQSCNTLQAMAHQASQGYGYRWELVRKVLLSPPSVSDTTDNFPADFVQRQCVHFAAGYVASLYASGRAAWHIAGATVSTADAEAQLHAALRSLLSGAKGAMDTVEQLLGALTPQMASTCLTPPEASSSPNVVKPSSRNRSSSLKRFKACLIKKDKRPPLSPCNGPDGAVSKSHHRSSSIVPLQDMVVPFYFTHALPFPPVIGTLYYTRILQACYPVDDDIVVDEEKVLDLLQYALQLPLHVSPLLHQILHLQCLLEAYERNPGRWRDHLRQMDQIVNALCSGPGLECAVDERRRLDQVLRQLTAHLQPLLASIHEHFDGRPQQLRCAVSLYCSAMQLLHQGPDVEALLVDDLQDSLHCSATAAYFSIRQIFERRGPISLLLQMHEFVAEKVLPYFTHHFMPMAALICDQAGLDGDVVSTAFVKCIGLDIISLVTSGRGGPTTVDRALLGLLGCLQQLVCAAGEAGFPVDFVSIAADVDTLNNILHSIASEWFSQMQTNFRQYFDHMVYLEDWRQLGQGTAGQVFHSAVDLLHMFDSNIPAINALLLPQVQDFIRGYAQTISGFVQEYAVLVAGNGTLINTARVPDIVHGWQSPDGEGSFDEQSTPPSIPGLCQALNTLVWLLPDYERLITSLSTRETGTWMESTKQVTNIPLPGTQQTCDVIQQSIQATAQQLGFALVFTSPVRPLLMNELYSVDMKHYRAHKAAVKASHGATLEAALRPATSTTMTTILHQLDEQLTAALNLISDEVQRNKVVAEVVIYFCKGLMQVLLDGGEARVFTPHHADSLYQDLAAIVAFFSSGNVTAWVENILGERIAELKAVLDLMQVPSKDLLQGGVHGAAYDQLGDDPSQTPLTKTVVRAILTHRKDADAKRFTKRNNALTMLPAGLRHHVSKR